MNFDHVFSWNRWRTRFQSETTVRDNQRAPSQEPDATTDEVGSAGDGEGFDGRPIKSKGGNGQGSGDVGGSGWAGWGA